MSSAFYKYFPVFLFALVWSLVFYCLSLGLYNINDISSNTFQVLITGIIAFVLGYVLFTAFDLNFAKEYISRPEIIINDRLLGYLVSILVTLSIIGSFMIMVAIGQSTGKGLSAYVRSPIEVRQEFVWFITDPTATPPLLFKLGSYIVNFSFVGNLLGGILLTVNNKKRLIGLLPLLAAIFSSFATLGRFGLVNSIGVLFISFIISSSFYEKEYRTKLLRKFFVYSLVVLIGLGFIFYSIVSIRIVTGVDVSEYFFRTLYFYFTGGVAAFENFLDSTFTHKYGLSSFRSAFIWLGRFNIWPEEEIISGFDKFTRVSPNLRINTYTYAKSLYLDFGIYGVVLVNFIWGAVIQVLLKKAYSRFSLSRLFWASVVIFGSLMSFYSFYFQSITLIIFWAISMGVINFLFGDKLFLRNRAPVA